MVWWDDDSQSKDRKILILTGMTHVDVIFGPLVGGIVSASGFFHGLEAYERAIPVLLQALVV
jgi:hypothetical protein